jgi:4-hydroxy-3-methylbut-2-enyl diphosphate reductase
VYAELLGRGIQIIDTTCRYVEKIHKIVGEHYGKGYSIVICGYADHAEVIGINGCCQNSGQIISAVGDIDYELLGDNVCIVSQTTFLQDIMQEIVKNITAINAKTVVVFDTICYTTKERQDEALEFSYACDLILVVGSIRSSNTGKLVAICSANCKTILVQAMDDLKRFDFTGYGIVGIISGASTPEGLILEVIHYMSEKLETEFGQLLNEEKHVNYRQGNRLKATVISADDKGIVVRIGGKNDGIIHPDQAVLEGDYNPADFKEGAEVNVVIVGTKESETGLIPVSKKEIDAQVEGDKIINTIRNGEEFSLPVKRVIEKGLLAKLGNYRVFIPQSQVQINFVHDLKQYENKTLRLVALSIDDEKHNVVASQKKVLEDERAKVENEFFETTLVNDIVVGKVLRVTPFGAFVDVKGFDCLAHIADLTWNKISKVEDILTIGSEYDFVVLNIDREKSRVSLGYKQLHPHPFEDAVTKLEVGSTIAGKVVRLAPFGAFVEIADGVDGLVHISEASHDYVKNINEVLKVNQEITAVITKIDLESRKISLSIKAATPAPEIAEIVDDDFLPSDMPARKTEKRIEKFEKKLEAVAPNADGTQAQSKIERKRPKKIDPKEGGPREWSEGSQNTPFADLLKGFSDSDTAAPSKSKVAAEAEKEPEIEAVVKTAKKPKNAAVAEVAKESETEAVAEVAKEPEIEVVAEVAKEPKIEAVAETAEKLVKE